MMTHPQDYAARFIEAGATSVLIHVEASCDVAATLAAIRQRGVRAGITLKPATPAASVFPVLAQVDEVLIMTVEPGYGGQAFMNAMLSKVLEIRREANRGGLVNLQLMVDGGINQANAALCAACGANAFVAGSSLFGLADMRAGVDEMRQAASVAYGRELQV